MLETSDYLRIVGILLMLYFFLPTVLDVINDSYPVNNDLLLKLDFKVSQDITNKSDICPDVLLQRNFLFFKAKLISSELTETKESKCIYLLHKFDSDNIIFQFKNLRKIVIKGLNLYVLKVPYFPEKRVVLSRKSKEYELEDIYTLLIHDLKYKSNLNSQGISIEVLNDKEDVKGIKLNILKLGRDAKRLSFNLQGFLMRTFLYSLIVGLIYFLLFRLYMYWLICLGEAVLILFVVYKHIDWGGYLANLLYYPIIALLQFTLIWLLFTISYILDSKEEIISE